MQTNPDPREADLAETLPPLGSAAAITEAHRCLFCYDAPCAHACPTHIDIPGFIKKIAYGNMLGSARTIFDANLLGATCARVCPVQELCEGACVLGSTNQPIAIGRLQRHAMDYAYGLQRKIIDKAESTGRKVAVVGAGPAGLSCAGELARRGHSVTVFERRELAGGLSTYGIISLREPTAIALAEARMIEGLGVEIRTGVALGEDVLLAELQAEFDMVVLSVGLGRVPELSIPGEEHVVDGLGYIEECKADRLPAQSGAEVLVIGAGNTAIDCATIARRMGARSVTILYRRGEREMSAYPHEYDFAKREGISFRFFTQPVGVVVEAGLVTGLRCARTRLQEGVDAAHAWPVVIPGEEFVLSADCIVKAIGQNKPTLAQALGLRIAGGFIAVDDQFETSLAGVFAIGDCIRATAAASTVMAVQDGKMAAVALHERLRATTAVRGGTYARG